MKYKNLLISIKSYQKFIEVIKKNNIYKMNQQILSSKVNMNKKYKCFNKKMII